MLNNLLPTKQINSKVTKKVLEMNNKNIKKEVNNFIKKMKISKGVK